MSDDSTLEASQKSNYYSSPGRLGLIQQLIHLAQFGDGLSVVQGAAGAGKSALAKQLVESIKSRVGDLQSVRLIPVVHDEQLLDTLLSVSRSIGLPGGEGEVTSVGEILSEIRHYSQGLISDKKLTVLVFDDAHSLAGEALGALLSLLQGESPSGYGLHLVFFSKPGLANEIDALQLVDLSAYDFDVPLFSPSELSQFIAAARGAIDAELSADQVQAIWSQSKGNPGIALRLYDDSLVEGKPSDKVSLFGRRAIPVGHGLALLLLISVLVWALLARETDDVSSGASPVGGDQKVDLAKIVNPQKTKSNSMVRQPVAGFIEAPKIHDSDSGKVARGQEFVDSALLDEENTLGVEAGEQVVLGDIIAEEVGESGGEKVSRAEPNRSPSVSIPDIVQPTLKVEGVGEGPMSADAVLLLEQPDSYFTLQVLAASKKGSLQEYIDRQQNRQDLYLYQGLREGRRLYVVIAGVYPSRKMALEARKALPPEQRKAGPWPRSLKGIKEEIEANQRN